MRTLTLALLLAATSASAASWQVGDWAVAYQYNVITQGLEIYADTYTGYLGDDSSPLVGDVFYGEVGVAIVGASINGGGLAHVEVTLPPSTTFAISDQNQVFCTMRDIETRVTTPLPTDQCPQSFDAIHPLQGDYLYGAIWVPDGQALEIHFPLRSTATLSGMAGGQYLSAAIKVISDSSQWVYPSEGVFVFPNPPGISYPEELPTEVTTTTAILYADVLNHYQPGTAYFDLGTTEAYELENDSAELGSDVPGLRFTDTRSGLTPSTTYHWRVRFVDDQGVETAGEDQVFRTADLPTYSVTIAPVTGGTVEVSPNQDRYPEGSLVTITAQPAAGFVFSGWVRDGQAAGAENPLTLEVTADTLVEAQFSEAPASGGDEPGTPSDPGTQSNPGTPSEPGTPSDGGQSSTMQPSNPAGGCSATGAEAGITPLLLFLFALRRRSAASV